MSTQGDPNEVEFWDLVSDVLERLFGLDPSRMEQLRGEVASLPRDERRLFFHSEALDVAADLAGIHSSPSLVDKYLDLIRDCDQGGIHDFDPAKLLEADLTSVSHIPLPINIAGPKRAGIRGHVPVIFSITAVSNLPFLLASSEDREQRIHKKGRDSPADQSSPEPPAEIEQLEQEDAILVALHGAFG